MAIKTSGFGILLIGVMAMPACFDASSPDHNDDDASACESDTDCKGARVCVDGECVDPAPNGSGGSGSASAGGSGTAGVGPAGGSPSMTGGAPNGGGGTPEGGSAGSPGGSSGEGGASGTSSGGSGNGGAGGAPTSCTSSSPILCPSSSTMELCVDGTYETYSCSAACSSLGFATGPCTAGVGCECGDATNQECALGASAFCVCANSLDIACSDADALNMYVSCHTNDPPDTASVVRCFENYVSGTTVDCESAITYCL